MTKSKPLWEPADAKTTKKMRAVRQKGTSPEIAVRDALDGMGIEFEINIRDKPGRPDIWITQGAIPIFVHGCFWHRHEGCRKSTMPKKNREYWTTKFRQNIERDARKAHELEALGHSPITIWQCETSDKDMLAKLLARKIEAAASHNPPQSSAL